MRSQRALIHASAPISGRAPFEEGNLLEGLPPVSRSSQEQIRNKSMRCTDLSGSLVFYLSLFYTRTCNLGKGHGSAYLDLIRVISMHDLGCLAALYDSNLEGCSISLPILIRASVRGGYSSTRNIPFLPSPNTDFTSTTPSRSNSEGEFAKLSQAMYEMMQRAFSENIETPATLSESLFMSSCRSSTPNQAKMLSLVDSFHRS